LPEQAYGTVCSYFTSVMTHCALRQSSTDCCEDETATYGATIAASLLNVLTSTLLTIQLQAYSHVTLGQVTCANKATVKVRFILVAGPSFKWFSHCAAYTQYRVVQTKCKSHCVLHSRERLAARVAACACSSADVCSATALACAACTQSCTRGAASVPCSTMSSVTTLLHSNFLHLI